LLPESERDWKRINVEPPPPGGLVTCAMQFAVMDPADRNGELVTHTASECAGLGKGEVMRIRWHATAHETGLSEHVLQMIFVPQTDRLTHVPD
jgi:hypothetical protein